MFRPGFGRMQAPISLVRWPRGIFYSGIVGVLTLAVAEGAAPPVTTPTPQAVGTPAAAPASPLDEPLRLIGEARTAYAGVRDYSCVMIKKEKLGGPVPQDSIINMQVRTQPFSVDLQWLEPKSMAGQEACYVAGKNEGKMRVHSTGLLGVAGFVSLDPNDPRAQKSSRHNITEAGIGNLIDRFATRWEGEKRLNLTQVKVGEYEFSKRRCIRVETTHPRPDNRFAFYRSVLYFDKETHLPIRVEAYNWPQREGDPGEVVEIYSYVNMRLNIGLPDAVFEH